MTDNIDHLADAWRYATMAAGPVGGLAGGVGLAMQTDAMLREQTRASLAEPRGDLNVDDIVKLATAGVKMDWADIKHRINVPKPEHRMFTTNDRLLKPLLQRYMNNKSATREDRFFGTMDGEIFPFTHISASVHGSKVYVFVHHMNEEPMILQDDKEIYPSDGLMARLYLLEKAQEGKMKNMQGTTQAPQAQPAQVSKPSWRMRDLGAALGMQPLDGSSPRAGYFELPEGHNLKIGDVLQISAEEIAVVVDSKRAVIGPVK